MKDKIWLSSLVGLASVGALLMFTWPLFLTADGISQSGLAQGAFIGLMPMLVWLILIEFSSGRLDSRRLAILGLLIALNSVIRLLGAGVSGIETVFFLIVIGGYVFGAGFAFMLATGSLLVSALLGAGVGPWLPFQMMAAGFVGIGAGLLAKLGAPRNLELFALSVYAILASFVYGGLMTMWNWPFLAGVGSSVSYKPDAPLIDNLAAFLRYEIFTGGLMWDLGRAATTVVLIALTGKTLLATLRRAANKVEFG